MKLFPRTHIHILSLQTKLRFALSQFAYIFIPRFLDINDTFVAFYSRANLHPTVASKEVAREKIRETSCIQRPEHSTSDVTSSKTNQPGEVERASNRAEPKTSRRRCSMKIASPRGHEPPLMKYYPRQSGLARRLSLIVFLSFSLSPSLSLSFSLFTFKILAHLSSSQKVSATSSIAISLARHVVIICLAKEL